MRVRTPLVAGLAMLALAAPAYAAPRLKVTPAAAVPGATVAVARVTAKSKVTIGGKPATVAGKGRVVVPKVRPGRAVVKVKGAGRGVLTIRRRFTGTIGIAVDPKRKQSATIGAAGGTLTATRAGVKYVLTIPAGALTAATKITMTPATSVTGLPIAGRPVAVRFAPEGLHFTQPATLTITLPKRAPGPLAGFGATGRGTNAHVVPAPGSRRSVVLSIPHFSVDGIGWTSEADAAALADPLLANPSPTRATLDELAALMKEWERMFPGFCRRQEAVCLRVAAYAQAAYPRLIREACDAAKPDPTLAAVKDIVDLDAQAQVLGAEPSTEVTCTDDLIETIMDRAVQRLNRGDPFHLSEDSRIPPALRPQADLNHDGLLNRFEWVVIVTVEAQVYGVDSAASAGLHATDASTKLMETTGLTRCDTDIPAGMSYLDKALKLVQSLGAYRQVIQDAIWACDIVVTLAPTELTLPTDSYQQFTATITGGGPNGPGGVSWSATRGFVNATGQLLTPSTAGDLTVTATSNVNSRRKATATVHVSCTTCAPVISNIARGSALLMSLSAASGGTTNPTDNGYYFNQLGQWDESHDLTQHADSATGTADASLSGSQHSNVTVNADGLAATITQHASGTATRTGDGYATTAADGSMQVRWTVGETTHHYTLTGSRTSASTGAMEIRISHADDNNDSDVFSIIYAGSGSFTSSGPLTPGKYLFYVLTRRSETSTLPSTDADVTAELHVTR